MKTYEVPCTVYIDGLSSEDKRIVSANTKAEAINIVSDLIKSEWGHSKGYKLEVHTREVVPLW